MKQSLIISESPQINSEQLLEKLRGLFAGQLMDSQIQKGLRRELVSLDLHRDHYLSVVKKLKEELGFHFLSDLAGVDYLTFPDPQPQRFALMLLLRNLPQNLEVRIRAFIPESSPYIASITSLYKGAVWQEREVFDLYGIDFKGHPDMRRILMPDDYEGHPLRKDYPLQGRGERSDFRMIKMEDIKVLE